MGALLDGEGAVGVGRLDLEGGGLDSGLFRVGRVVDLRRVAVAFRPPQVHPHQHLGEVRGIDATCFGADGDQGLALVVLPGEQGADLLGVDLLLQGDPFLLGLDQGFLVLVAKFEHDLQVIQALPQFLDPLEFGLGVGQLAGDLLRVVLVVPQVRSAGFLGQLVNAGLDLLDVHDGLDARQGGVQSLQCSCVVEIHKVSAYAARSVAQSEQAVVCLGGGIQPAVKTGVR